jgi:hypothetical protein
MRALGFFYYLHFVYALLLIFVIAMGAHAAIIPFLMVGLMVWTLEGCMQLNGRETILTPLFGKAVKDN